MNYASAMAYDKFGQRLSMTYGNGVVTNYAYRPDNRRLLNIQASLPSGGYTFHNFFFTYDNVGNVTQLQNQVQPPPTNSIGGPETKTFVYDDLYQLTSSAGCHDTSTSCLNTPPTGSLTYSFSQSYDSIHNITNKTQTATQNSAVNPQLSYNNAYTYPAPGSAHPHGPTAIGGFTITNDADGNQINTLGTGTSDQSQYLYDEENRLSCANKGPQTPSPSCSVGGDTQFIYDHAGVRKIKSAATPTIYPNQFYTDFGGGSGNQFKHIFIGSERILTKKSRMAPDREHWYYHGDHLHSTGMVTNEKSEMVDAIHYFPFGEVWQEEVPSSLPTDYFFTAKEFDPETGFYDFGARYLDPRFSKWMTADPALGEYLPEAGKIIAYQSPSPDNRWRSYPDLPGLGGAFRPQNMALYTYVGNDPLNLTDPTGRDALVIVAGRRTDSKNVFGHVSIAVTGGGIYSFGTGTALASSVSRFVKEQSDVRSQTLYTIKTTPEQDAAMLAYLKSQTDNIGLWDNCAARTWEALKAGGVLDSPIKARTPDADAFQLLSSGANFSRLNVPLKTSIEESVTKQFERDPR